MHSLDVLHGLPGADLIIEGLTDLAQGRVTAAACLADMSRPRLEQAGLWNVRGADDGRSGRARAARASRAARAHREETQPTRHPREIAQGESERILYRLLCAEGGDAYPRYNALVRRLVSFERALDHRLTRTAGRSGQG